MSPKKPNDSNEDDDIEFEDEDDELEEEENEELDDDVPDYMVVFFDSFPSIDIQRLIGFFKASDPEEAALTLQPGSHSTFQDSEPDHKVETFSCVIEDYEIVVFARDMAWTEREVIDELAQVSDEDKRLVAGHRAHVEINIFGGANFAPYERMILLLKAAVAVCEQGGIGVFNPAAGIYYPAEAVANLIDMNRQAIAAEEPTLWETLRGEGEPARLLMNIELIGIEERIFLITRGQDTCGLPDFIAELGEDAGEEEIHALMDFFETAFAYLISNDMTIEPPATIVFEDNAQFQFTEAPEWIQDEFPDTPLLLVEQVEGEEEDEGE